MRKNAASKTRVLTSDECLEELSKIFQIAVFKILSEDELGKNQLEDIDSNEGYEVKKFSFRGDFSYEENPNFFNKSFELALKAKTPNLVKLFLNSVFEKMPEQIVQNWQEIVSKAFDSEQNEVLDFIKEEGHKLLEKNLDFEAELRKNRDELSKELFREEFQNLFVQEGDVVTSSKKTKQGKIGQQKSTLANLMELLQYADIEFNLEGWTPLHFAAKYGTVENVDQLIQKGFKVDAKSESGISVLNFAEQSQDSGNENCEAIKELLNRKLLEEAVGQKTSQEGKKKKHKSKKENSTNIVAAKKAEEFEAKESASADFLPPAPDQESPSSSENKKPEAEQDGDFWFNEALKKPLDCNPDLGRSDRKNSPASATYKASSIKLAESQNQVQSK